MIAEWLKDVHIALHDSRIIKVMVRGEDRQIFPAGNNCRLLCVPGNDKSLWVFITQNPNTNSEWAQRAKQGQKVTQVKLGAKYYGVIVGEHVFRYTKKGDAPLWMGTLEPILKADTSLESA